MTNTQKNTIQVINLRTEYQQNPLGIDATAPRLSWQLQGERNNIEQIAYQLRISRGGGDVWDTGKVISDRSTNIRYEGPILKSLQCCEWQVRIWDEADVATDWSEPAIWEMGLLNASDWQASWIEVPWEEEPKEQHPAPYFRREFELGAAIVSARLLITAHGTYEAHINGQVVGDAVLTPGYTSYEKRLQYQTYDVTDLLQVGDNCLGAIVGDGWWRGAISVESIRNAYGERLGLLAELHITLADGSKRMIATDGKWSTSTGPIRLSDLKDGEHYDARREVDGWDQPGLPELWSLVSVADYPYDNLVAPVAPPVRRKEHFAAVEVLKTPSGQTVIDFGQNIAGRTKLSVDLPAGTKVVLTHGEVLDKEGNFTMSNLNTSGGTMPPLLQEVHYTAKDGPHTYESYFTFHGFRYVMVEGFEPTLESVEAIALYSDLGETGTFECSDERLNQLQSNIMWSQKGNFLSIPTDCPQRERAGWTGDAQLYARTGLFLMDATTFYEKYMRDLAVEQAHYGNGRVPNLIPNSSKMLKGFSIIEAIGGAAGWGDAAVILPWVMYEMTGDQAILENHYDGMKDWLGFVQNGASITQWSKRLSPFYRLNKARRQREPFIWNNRYHWGEWLVPGDSYDLWNVGLGMLNRILFSEPEVGTAYFAYSSRILSETAALLGHDEEAKTYAALSEQVRQVYVGEFVSVSESGSDSGGELRIAGDKQACYVRALQLNLLEPEMRPLAAKRLVELIREADTHLGTGFLSTPFLLPILTEMGYLDVASEVLLQDTVPSWLYPITKGATTIWEMWDAIRPDGTVHASHNHYAYGAVGTFLYEYAGGIQPLEPGFKRIQIKPIFVHGLTHVHVTYQSLYGVISSEWHIVDGQVTLNVTIPPNTTAEIWTSEDDVVNVGSGQYEYAWAMGSNSMGDVTG